MKDFFEFREDAESKAYDKWVKAITKKYGKGIEFVDGEGKSVGDSIALKNGKEIDRFVSKKKGKGKSSAKGRDPTGGRLSKGQSVYD